MSSREAIYQACLLRFRPIMMTTMAAMLGALPLAIGFGEGAELRQPLGISIVGGLIVSQMLTLYTTPVIYLYLDRFRLWSLRPLASALSRCQRRSAGARRMSKHVAPLKALSIAAVALVAACTVGPDYQRPAAPVPAAYKEAGWKAGEPHDAIDRGAWWSIYNDPVLDELERQIDISNQNLKAAEAAFRQARAVVAQARAGFFPTDLGRRIGDALGPRRQQLDEQSQQLHRRQPLRPRQPDGLRSDGRRELGASISGAGSAAPSRATSRAPRRAPPISPARGSRRRRTLATDYLAAARSPTS